MSDWFDVADFYATDPTGVRFYFAAPTGGGGPAPRLVAAYTAESGFVRIIASTEREADYGWYDWEDSWWESDRRQASFSKARLAGPDALIRAGGYNPDTGAADDQGPRDFIATLTIRGQDRRYHTLTLPVIVGSGGVPKPGTPPAGNAASVFPMSYTHGEPVSVESVFYMAAPTTVMARLVQVSSTDRPGIINHSEGEVRPLHTRYDPAARVVVETKTQTFGDEPADATGRTWRTYRELIRFTVTHPQRATGYGFDYRIEIDLPTGERAISEVLPVWVHGTSDGFQPVTAAPPASTFGAPAWATRPAADHAPMSSDPIEQAKYDTLFSRELRNGGAGIYPDQTWVNWKAYNAALWWVDLDDATIPRYDVRYYDYQALGFQKTAWDRVDPNPNLAWPQDSVALSVPIPDYAFPTPGTDRAMVIVGTRKNAEGQPYVDTVWETWKCQRLSDGGWRAVGMAKTHPERHFQQASGYTSSASGISNAMCVLRVGESKVAMDYLNGETAAGRTPDSKRVAGIIAHPISIVLAHPYSKEHSWPAVYHDGNSDDPYMMREGQIAYLPDIDPWVQSCTLFEKMLLCVMKHRGLICNDRTDYNGCLIVENDSSYGTNGDVWATIRGAHTKTTVYVPPTGWRLAKSYTNKADWDSRNGASGETIPLI